MTGNYKPGFIAQLVIGLIVAFAMSWFLDFQNTRGTLVAILVAVVLFGLTLKIFDHVNIELNSGAEWKLPWRSFFIVFLPSLAVFVFAVIKLYKCRVADDAMNWDWWLFILFLSLLGFFKFIDDGEERWFEDL